VLDTAPNLLPGGRVVLRMRVGPFWRKWVAEHRGYISGREFRDVQISGPFAFFEHTHRITPDGSNACWLDDEIAYVLPGGWLGRVITGRWIERRLSCAFAYRHAITAADLALSVQGTPAMKVLITGATGLVGRHLAPFLTTQGHEVFRLVRGTPKEANDIPWDPAQGELPAASLEGLDGVVHLAGEPISKRWTAVQKERIVRSRVDSTRLLCDALSKLQRKPKVLVCASAIGYYGDRGSESLTEDSSRGAAFLADVCEGWEAACDPARAAGIRVVNLRTGVVLSMEGGALAQMLLPFRAGVGGVVGSGRQYWSWIAVDDVAGAIHHCLTHAELTGPVNATAPLPATNYEFTKTLGGILHRPTFCPVPAFAARTLLGEMADELLLASARVLPQKLQQTGYQFRFATLESALRHVLGRH